MAVPGSLQISHELGLCRNHGCSKQILCLIRSGRSQLLKTGLSSLALRQDPWSIHLSGNLHKPICSNSCKHMLLKCHSLLNPGKAFEISSTKTAAIAFTRASNVFRSSPIALKLVSAIGIIVFAMWGLAPIMRQGRNVFLHKNDSSWKKSGTYYVMTSYLQPLLLWTGATLICRVLDPVVLPSEASEIVKQRLLNFIRSLSTVLALAYCLSSVIQQVQRFFMETNNFSDPRSMGFEFAGKAVYTAVWVAAVSLFMELLGFSTQKWLTAGGLGTVLLTLAGREIFTNFLSSVMIHATRPFVGNEWIQTKIEGYEVSGTVEHVGWWSPTIIRGEDREAVHIPNHKFTVNVVRNLSQKTHWRIKTHLAISHLDVNKINNIVADMRKVLAKNPQVEHKRLHRRVFLENVNPENQALMILVSCFVKTSHFEEYLCVKEAILLDLLRVISHHHARLATPIRTVQKIYNDSDLENMPFSESTFNRGAASNRPLLLIEPHYKIYGEDRTKTQTRPIRANVGQDSKAGAKVDAKAGATMPESKGKESSSSGIRTDAGSGDMQSRDKTSNNATASTSQYTTGDKAVGKSTSKTSSKVDGKSAEVASSEFKTPGSTSTQNISNNKQQKKMGSSLETGGEKTGESLSTSQPKQENERISQPPISRASLEDNIVLGVALDGSKRTLPIEEGMAPASTLSEVKELNKYRNGNGPPVAEKDMKDGQLPNVPSAGSGHQRHQQD